MRWFLLLLFGFVPFWMTHAQEATRTYRKQRYAVADTVKVDSVSINPFRFAVLKKNGDTLSSSNYVIDYQNAKLSFSSSFKSTMDSVDIVYFRYPEFVTKKYFQYDPSRIVSDEENQNLANAIQLTEPNRQKTFIPFDGLSTAGSISRAVRVGNNQNTVLDSELDLQITGQLSENISLRASIQDANVPVQQVGFSQNLDEFDQIFIELIAPSWRLRAGDITLQNTDSRFSRFTKKVQGILGSYGSPQKKVGAFGSGALVRGVFNRSEFTGQEGNQGPYKLTGPNGELLILIISGSERVYVNGILLERGENEDYVIDYNAGEVRFNPTYPINSTMRIVVEYQLAERNFSRIITYNGGSFTTEKLKLSGFVYSENDLKNQSLQQNLTDAQKQILSEAGDDQSQMIAPSAIADNFSENKILYRRELQNGAEVFVFSTDPEEELFNVRFTQVGANNGDYILASETAINRIFEYVAPINGIPQGSFAPIIQLDAPERLQTAVIQGSYQPLSQTQFNFEVAGSRNDLNLFSDLDDADNTGLAFHLDGIHQFNFKPKKWNLNVFGSLDRVEERYRSPERIYNVEFNRDWNLDNPTGSQWYGNAGIEATFGTQGKVKYALENLDFSDSYTGRRHLFSSFLRIRPIYAFVTGSLLNSSGTQTASTFARLSSGITYGKKKYWAGTRLDLESNKEQSMETQNFTPLSQRFSSHEVFMGVGDSTDVYATVGYQYRINDSVRNARLQSVNTSQTYYLKTQLKNTTNTQLFIYANYRSLDNIYEEAEFDNEEALNGRILYTQRLFRNKMQLNTTFETNSGTVPRQEFSFVQVDPGEGTHTWNDYNDNGVQELSEFEIAQFQDQATYIRVILPNRIFLKAHRNRWSQTLTLQPRSWQQSKQKYQRLLSHFYTQTSLVADRQDQRRNNEFEISPFGRSENTLELQNSFRNLISFNRGLQNYTTSYTYTSTTARNVLTIGIQESEREGHQLNFSHLLQKSWLLEFEGIEERLKNSTENFTNRNYRISSVEVSPSLSYLFSKQTQFGLSYTWNQQRNQLEAFEELRQHELNASFTIANKDKLSMNGEVSYFDNQFTGNAFSPVGYEMLEGLQPGTNFTWTLLVRQKLTSYLDLNVSYFGRKSETSSTIHTGNVQLRAYF